MPHPKRQSTQTDPFLERYFNNLLLRERVLGGEKVEVEMVVLPCTLIQQTLPAQRLPLDLIR